MQAGFYERTGLAHAVLRVGEVADPVPGVGEVRVRMRWSGVNPSDAKSRAGLRSTQMPFARVIPHSDGMGVIDELGEGVPRQRLGQRVWLWNAAWRRPGGTAAQWVVLRDEMAVALPDTTSDQAGACLGIPAMTALHAVLALGGVAGQRVLVAGGAGAVGHYAVQFARLLGARQVLASVSSADKARLARDAGADTVLNYREAAIGQQVRDATGGQGVDRIIEVDMAANAQADLDMLRAGGQLVVYGSGAPVVEFPFFPLIVNNIQLAFFIVYNLGKADRQHAQSVLDGFLQRGALQHNIARTLPLAQIADAHQLVEQGPLAGNLVLSVP